MRSAAAARADSEMDLSAVAVFTDMPAAFAAAASRKANSASRSAPADLGPARTASTIPARPKMGHTKDSLKVRMKVGESIGKCSDHRAEKPFATSRSFIQFRQGSLPWHAE